MDGKEEYELERILGYLKPEKSRERERNDHITHFAQQFHLIFLYKFCPCDLLSLLIENEPEDEGDSLLIPRVSSPVLFAGTGRGMGEFYS